MLLLFYLRLLLICPRVTCGLDWVVLMWFVIFDAKCRTEAWEEGKWECGKRVSECDCGFEECVIGCYFLDGLCPLFKVTWSKKWDIIEKWGFPGGSVVRNLPASAGDLGSIPGSERSSGGGNGNPRARAHTHTHTHTHTPVYLKQYSRFEKKDTPLLQSLPGVIWFPYNIYCLFATKSFFQSHLVLVWNLEELALLPLIVANISIWNLSVLFCFSLQTNYFFPGSALSYQAFPDSAGNNQHAQLMCLLSSPLVSTGSRSTFWMRKWQPASVSLPGESHGQRSLLGYSP